MAPKYFTITEIPLKPDRYQNVLDKKFYSPFHSLSDNQSSIHYEWDEKTFFLFLRQNIK